MTAQSFAYEKKGNSAVIWRCFSHDTRAEVPQEIAGFPVTEIAPYAFSAHMDERALEKGIQERRIRIYVPEALHQVGEEYGAQNQNRMLPPTLCGNRIEEVVFPTGIVRVGKYCFYNCENLHELEFYAKLADWGSGAFTGCHKIRKLRAYIPENGISSLKPVLEELREELSVEYIPEQVCGRNDFAFDDPERSLHGGMTGGPDAPEHPQISADQYAYLVFPEFYEEGIENTPARILEEKVHGTGVHFRNCFYNKIFDFRQYDSLFQYAVTQESPQTMAELAMGRLRHPYSLSEAAAEQYLKYVRENGTVLAEMLLTDRDMDGIRWLFDAVGQNVTLTDYVTKRASELKFAEALGYLMEHQRKEEGPVRRRRREL